MAKINDKKFVFHIEQMITKYFENFLNSGTCCSILPIIYTDFYQNETKKLILLFGIDSKIYSVDGIKYIYIYKDFCDECFQINSDEFKLNPKSMKILKKSLHNLNYACLNERFALTPGVFKKNNLRVHSFAININKSLSIPSVGSNCNINRRSMPIYRFRKDILQNISKNQIVAICGNSGFGKSSQIPQFILENASETNKHCRIVFNQIHEISVIKLCEVITKQRKEQLGVTVGYQTQLKTVFSNSTNLLLTTNEFFLRSLVGSSLKTLFRNVTHIIIDDIHERNYYADLVYFELKKILITHVDIKIIFLCFDTSNVKFLKDYFNDIQVLDMNFFPKEFSTTMKYLKPTLALIDPSISFMCQNNRKSNCDKNTFLKERIYKIQKYSRNDKLVWFSTLLRSLKMDRITYTTKYSALEILSAAERKPNCITKLQLSHQDHIPVDVIYSLIRYVHTNCGIGTILVFLPQFEDLLRLEYMINRYELSNPSYLVKVLKLYHTIEIDELTDIFQAQSTSNFRQILLCNFTNYTEVCFNLRDIYFVIDCRQHDLIESDTLPNSISNQQRSIEKEKFYEQEFWRNNCKHGLYFHLHAKSKKEIGPKILTPEESDTNLEKICLLVKALSPNTSVLEYLKKTTGTFNLDIISKTIKLLIEISALDEEENLTALGALLLDIPVPVQLGKVIIYSIIFQCLDPVLTIISSLIYANGFQYNNIKHFGTLGNESNFLVENLYSDHFILLRLFNVWQQNRNIYMKNKMPMKDYLMDMKLQMIYNYRCKIVANIRAAQLIHSQGLLSMNNVNMKRDNWSLIKACFVAGMHPNICKIKPNLLNLKTLTKYEQNIPKHILIHSNSILRKAKSISMDDENIKYLPSNWILHNSHYNSNNIETVQNNTLVAPLSIALFCGKLENFDVQQFEENSYFRLFQSLHFEVKNRDFNLIFILRQKCSILLLDLLEHFENNYRMLNSGKNVSNKFSTVDLLCEILTIEEELRFPERADMENRPKSFTNYSKDTTLELSVLRSNFLNEMQGTRNESDKKIKPKPIELHKMDNLIDQKYSHLNLIDYGLFRYNSYLFFMFSKHSINNCKKMEKNIVKNQVISSKIRQLNIIKILILCNIFSTENYFNDIFVENALQQYKINTLFK